MQDCRPSRRQSLPQLPTRCDPELREYLSEVALDRSRAQEELGADLLLGMTIAGETSNLLLLWGEGIASVQSALADVLARRGEFASSTICERVMPIATNSW